MKDVRSVRYIFNPAVMKIADIENLQQEIIATAEAGPFLTTFFYRGQILESNKPLAIKGVRVSFEVVPKNGEPRSRIVKTFFTEVISP